MELLISFDYLKSCLVFIDIELLREVTESTSGNGILRGVVFYSLGRGLEFLVRGGYFILAAHFFDKNA